MDQWNISHPVGSMKTPQNYMTTWNYPSSFKIKGKDNETHNEWKSSHRWVLMVDGWQVRSHGVTTYPFVCIK